MPGIRYLTPGSAGLLQGKRQVMMKIFSDEANSSEQMENRLNRPDRLALHIDPIFPPCPAPFDLMTYKITRLKRPKDFKTLGLIPPCHEHPCEFHQVYLPGNA